MFGDSVELDIAVIYDLIDDFMEDFLTYEKEKSCVIPPIVKGEFYGYIDGPSLYPVGRFVCDDGRVFVAEVGRTYEVPSRLIEVLEEISAITH